MTLTIPEKYLIAIHHIRQLYRVHGTGGYGHVVFDDGNYDCVRGCLHDARHEKYRDQYTDADDHDHVQELSINALEACIQFTDDEVELCVVIYRALEDGLLIRDL